jgi:hypothetical protein
LSLASRAAAAASGLIAESAVAITGEIDLSPGVAIPAAAFPSIVNLDLCRTSIAQLSELVASSGLAESDADVAEACAARLSRTGSLFGAELEKAVSLVVNELKNHVLPHFSSFCNADFSRVDDAAFAQAEASSGLVAPVLSATAIALGPIRRNLPRAVSQAVTKAFLARLSRHFEAFALEKSYNHLGGLLLDHEIRRAISALTEITGLPSRAELGRLTDIAVVLSIETLPEALREPVLVLTKREVQAVTQRRIDWVS